MRVFVSHLIRKGDPGWPGNPTVELNQYTSLENGDTANTYSFTLFIEDGHMAGLPSGFLKEAAAIPLCLAGLDSAPVTMWVEV